MKKWVDLAFDVGAVVYLKTDEDQKKRIVYSIEIKQTGVLYGLAQGNTTSWHFDFEISETADIKLKTSDK